MADHWTRVRVVSMHGVAECHACDVWWSVLWRPADELDLVCPLCDSPMTDLVDLPWIVELAAEDVSGEGGG